MPGGRIALCFDLLILLFLVKEGGQVESHDEK